MVFFKSTVACSAAALILLLRLPLTTATIPILVSKNIPLADGNYCFYCKPPTIAEAGACGSAAALNLQCFQDNAILQTCPAATDPNGINLDSFDVLSATAARVCVNVAQCLYLCAVVDLEAGLVEYVFCCFKPGSPLKGQFYDGTLSLPPPVYDGSGPPDQPPPPKKNTGVPCDLVQNAAKAYNMFQSAGYTGTGFWGQVLNLVCLGSDPSCGVPECHRVDSRRDPSCNNDDIPEGGFEQQVFNGFLGNIDFAALKGQAESVDAAAAAAALAAQAEINGGGQPALQAVLLLGNFNDPNLMGTVMMGFLHFVKQLGPLFQQYITDTVNSATSLDDLRNKIAAIKKEHHHLFFCQVIPGFQAEDDLDEIPKLNTWVAEVTVPLAATVIRNTELLVTMWKKFGFHPIDAFFKHRRRDDNDGASPLSERGGGSFLDTIPTASDFLQDLGYTPPKSPTLQSHFVNWQEPPDSIAWTTPSPPQTPAFPNIGPAEFSTAAGSEITVHRLLDNITMTVSTKDRPGYLDDLMALIGLLPTSSSSTSPALIPTLGKPVVIVGPIAVIWPNNLELIPGLTAILDLPSPDQSTTITTTPTTIASARPAPTLPPLNLTYTPTPPPPSDTHILYKTATLSLSLPPAKTWESLTPPLDPARDLTIIDLLTGLPLPDCTFTAPLGGTPGSLTARLTPGHGIWAGGFQGGGMYGVGVLGADGEPVRELGGWSALGVKGVKSGGSATGTATTATAGSGVGGAGVGSGSLTTQSPVVGSQTPGAVSAAPTPPPAGGATSPGLLPSSTTYALNTTRSSFPTNSNTNALATTTAYPGGLGAYIFHGMGGDSATSTSVEAFTGGAASGKGGRRGLGWGVLAVVMGVVVL